LACRDGEAVSSSGAYTTVTAAAASPADAITGTGSGNVDLTPYLQQVAAKIAASTLTIAFLSGIYLEVASLQLPPGLVPGPLKGKVSIYFSGWLYFEPSFEFSFNPNSSMA
jgi:hypothetical protein